MVELVPHEARDRVLASLRDRVRWSVLHLVATLGLRDAERFRVAANTLVHASSALGGRAADLERRVDARRLPARRRKERARAAGG